MGEQRNLTEENVDELRERLTRNCVLIAMSIGLLRQIFAVSVVLNCNPCPPLEKRRSQAYVEKSRRCGYILSNPGGQ